MCFESARVSLKSGTDVIDRNTNALTKETTGLVVKKRETIGTSR